MKLWDKGYDIDYQNNSLTIFLSLICIFEAFYLDCFSNLNGIGTLNPTIFSCLSKSDCEIFVRTKIFTGWFGSKSK